jgi:hypothetical protein
MVLLLLVQLLDLLLWLLLNMRQAELDHRRGSRMIVCAGGSCDKAPVSTVPSTAYSC